ncbi:MAG: hypothetical protein Q8L35_03965 [Actinomycetota bacterium]|nr:hypothetical protein [Actinomycetota bacterium]
MSRKILVIVLVLAMGALTTACAKTIAEKVIENQTGGKVKVNSGKGSVEIKGKGGTLKVGENTLPADFPKDVPVYKPNTVKSSMSNIVEGKKSFVVILTTKADVDAVADFYKKGLTGNGWTEKSALTGGEGGTRFATLGYEKGGAMVTVTITRANNDKETQMMISFNPKT